MKRLYFILIAMLTITLAACSSDFDLPDVEMPNIQVPTVEMPNIQVPTIEAPNIELPASQPGELITVNVAEEEPVPGGAARVEIEMGGGTLNLSGGGTGLVNGTIEYNIADWEPRITRSESTVRIEQDLDAIPIPQTGREMVNRWNLQLGDTPMALEINAGAYEGTINLSGVPLLELDIEGGANDSEVRFDAPNPENMTSFEFSTGASNVDLFGLGNANFTKMTFNGAAGDYMLDFSGQPKQESTVDVTGAVGQVTVRVPAGRSTTVNVSGGLNDVDTTGPWQVNENTYTLGGSGPLLTINVEMAVGNLQLVSE